MISINEEKIKLTTPRFCDFSTQTNHQLGVWQPGKYFFRPFHALKVHMTQLSLHAEVSIDAVNIQAGVYLCQIVSA
ncbi:hypothetical protein D3C87_1537540 [compost metagenome]